MYLEDVIRAGKADPVVYWFRVSLSKHDQRLVYAYLRHRGARGGNAVSKRKFRKVKRQMLAQALKRYSWLSFEDMSGMELAVKHVRLIVEELVRVSDKQARKDSQCL